MLAGAAGGVGATSAGGSGANVPAIAGASTGGVAAQTWEALLNVPSEQGPQPLDDFGTEMTTTPAASAIRPTGRLVEKRKIQELVGEIDPTEILEGDVEDVSWP